MKPLKVKFVTKQHPVSVREYNEKTYVEICVNEKIVNEEFDGNEETCYEYDYNEIIFPSGALDTEKIKKNPEEYLTFKYGGKTVEEVKKDLVANSKVALAQHLESHPLIWLDEKSYSVTAEKQSLLTSQLALFQLAAQAGVEYTLHWNATGEECTEWNYTDLSALAMAISAYVQPLVSKQQAYETAVMMANTEREANEIAFVL